MTHGHSLPEGLYEALLSIIREGYPGKEIKPLTNSELEAIEHDLDEIAGIRDDSAGDRRSETDDLLREIVRVTLENSGLQWDA